VKPACPLDGDILMHVAPACGTKRCPLDKIEVFRVPKGTLAWFYVPGVCTARRSPKKQISSIAW